MTRLRLTNLNLPLQEMTDADREADLLLAKAAAKCRVSADRLSQLTIVKKSLDARDKGRPVFV